MESAEQESVHSTGDKKQTFVLDCADESFGLDRHPEDGFHTYIMQAKKNITMLNYVEGCNENSLVEDENLEKCLAFESYELNLEKEIEEWAELYARICDKKEPKKSASVIIHRGILPESQRAYLEEATDLKQLVRYTQEFRQEALNLMDIDFDELKTKMEILKEIFQRRVNLMKRNAILLSRATHAPRPPILKTVVNHGQ